MSSTLHIALYDFHKNVYIALSTVLLRKEADAAMDQACVVAPPLPWNREGPMTRELLVDQSPNGKPRFFFGGSMAYNTPWSWENMGGMWCNDAASLTASFFNG